MKETYYAVHMEHIATGEKRIKKVSATSTTEATMKVNIGFGTSWNWNATEPFHHVSDTAFPIGGGYYKLPCWDKAAYEKYINRKKNADEQFADFLCTKNDLIDNAVHDLIAALTATDTEYDPSDMEWQMENIGPIADAAEEILIANGLFCCHPFQDENDNVCYKTDDCTNPNCIFKQS